MTERSIGIDVGGTFTDLVSIEPDGSVAALKVLSTPADQSDGVMAALASVGEAITGTTTRIVHGTTVATNTLLERNGARVVLCATSGVTDLLRLRRQQRAALYDLTRDHPPPLVDDAHLVPVPERVVPTGVLLALSPDAASAVAGRVRALDPEIVAVSLLHSYRHPAHERLLERALHDAMPGVEIVTSSDVLPEIREYERTTTTVAEAYLRPGVSKYLRRLEDRLREGATRVRR